MSRFDVVVIGAGPAGLCFARALLGSGLTVAVVERQMHDALAAPSDDGREIALTHRSQRALEALGLWARLEANDMAPLRDALVLDGDSIDGLRFRHEDSGHPQLGWLVPNRAIRRAAFAECVEREAATLFAGRSTVDVHVDATAATVVLDDGTRLHADLLIAADSRFSETRRALGIAATMRDFGKTMLVCRMRHDLPHAQTAWEWFDYAQTLALLPLCDANVSSVVLTVPHAHARALQAMDADTFSADMTRRFKGRLGAMGFIGPCCAYPLVGVYPERFVATRFACIGDAAVGMHPVTAHGFNFGLLGVDTLAALIREARGAGRAIHDDALLRRYERAHRRATKPLYLATRLLAGLYTDDSVPAKWARRAALRLAQRVRPFQRMVTAGLTDDGQASSLPAKLSQALPRLTGRVAPRPPV